MRRFLREMNPTLRGFLIVALVAAVIVVLQLERTLMALLLLAQIAFFIAIAVFVFLVWRERRSEIDTWSARGRTVFYGAAVLAVVDIGFLIVARPAGLDALVFFVVLILAGFSLWRVWRDERRLA